MRKIFIVTLFTIMSLCTSDLFYASADEEFTELFLFESIPEVTLPTRLPQKVTESPAAISVITADEIAHSGYTTVTDLLRNYPGVNVFTLSGKVTGVGIRGFNEKYSNKLQVLLDGRSIFNPLTQGVWWEDNPILLQDIDHIEIMRGPNSVLHGYNAVDGIINIVTKKPSETDGFATNFVVGTDSTQQAFGRYADSAGPFDYRFSYQRDNNRGLGDDDGREFFDSERLNALNFRSAYHVSDDTNFELLTGGKFGRRGAETISTLNDEDLKTDYELLRYNQNISDDSDLIVQFSRTLWDLDQDKNAGLHNSAYLQYDVDVQHSFKPLSKHQLVWGGNFRRNEARNRLLTDKTNDYHDTILRNFAQDAIELTEKLTLYMGGEWSQNEYTGSAWSFRHTAMYNLFEDHFLRFTIGKAYHAHGFVEYFFKLPGVINGNPDLENERLLAYEVGYKGSLLNKKLYFDVELFINDIDKIRNTTTVLPATFRNDNKADVYGVETALDYRPYKWLSTYFNYAALRVDDKLQIYDEQDPRHKVNLGFRLFWEKKFLPDYFDAKWSYVGSLGTIDPNSLPLVKTKVPNYFKLDIKLAKDIFNDSTEIAFVGQNLLDDDHFEFGADQTVNRQFLLTLRTEF